MLTHRRSISVLRPLNHPYPIENINIMAKYMFPTRRSVVAPSNGSWHGLLQALRIPSNLSPDKRMQPHPVKPRR